MTQAVIFLARGASDGRAAAERFFDSYRRHPAGVRHDLIVIMKAWQDEGQEEDVRRWAKGLGAGIIDLPDDGFDWGAYFRCAGRLDHEWVCLLNTHSEIIKDGWLEALCNAANGVGMGACGATGSWGTLATPLGDPSRMGKMLLTSGLALLRDHLTPAGLINLGKRLLASHERFPPFPNPNLRSNAFLTRRDCFLAYGRSVTLPKTKADAHLLECGYSSYTRFLESRGLASLVAGANGKSYAADSWLDSRTFRVPNQENLLISDNQTRVYQDAPRELRRRLEQLSWGRVLTP